MSKNTVAGCVGFLSLLIWALPLMADAVIEAHQDLAPLVMMAFAANDCAAFTELPKACLQRLEAFEKKSKKVMDPKRIAKLNGGLLAIQDGLVHLKTKEASKLKICLEPLPPDSQKHENLELERIQNSLACEMMLSGLLKKTTPLPENREYIEVAREEIKYANKAAQVLNPLAPANSDRRAR